MDSATALSVMLTLKDLAQKGECTVVSTIHQPQSKIFLAFDNLILMRKGDIVYQGGAYSSIEYFAKLGFPCPDLTNPADHLIDVIGGMETSGDEEAMKAQAAPGVLTWLSSKQAKFVVPVDMDFGGTKSSFDVKEWQPWYFQFGVLLQRNLHQHRRRWDIIAMSVFVAVLIATFTGMSVCKSRNRWPL